MNERKSIFWIEALKGGTVIGLVSVAFSLAMQGTEGVSVLMTALNVFSAVVMAVLAFAFTRRLAAKSSDLEGFSVGRAVGFVTAMMAIAGVLSGIYTSIMANFFIYDELMEVVEVSMAQIQDMIPAASFDRTYSLMRASVTNPLVLTLSSVIGNALLGVFGGLCVGLLTRRNPNIFAPVEEENNNSQQE